MRLTQLQYFKAVVEHGKIITAAQDLFISAPALSAAIGELEKELGVSLFERSGNRIALNEAGAILYACVERTFDDFERTKAELRNHAGLQKNILRIAMTAPESWAPLLSAFTHAHPEISLSCSTPEVQQLRSELASPLYQFILAERSDLMDTKLDFLGLFDEHPVALVPAEHPLAGRKSLALSDLCGQKLLLPPAGSSLNLRIRRLFSEQDLSPDYLCECAGEMAALLMTRDGCIGFCTDRSLPDRREGVHRVPVEASCIWRQGIFWNAGLSVKEKDATFLEFIKKESGCEA